MSLSQWWSGRQERARLAHARGRMAVHQFNEARLDLEGLTSPEATSLYTEALAALVDLNLDEAWALLHTGRGKEAEQCLDRAARFGASKDSLAAVKDGTWKPKHAHGGYGNRDERG